MLKIEPEIKAKTREHTPEQRKISLDKRSQFVQSESGLVGFNRQQAKEKWQALWAGMALADNTSNKNKIFNRQADYISNWREKGRGRMFQ